MTSIATPSVTLSEVLQLALPSGSRVVSGEHGLERRVHWARLLRARPSGLGGVEPGELLILPAALLEQLGEPRVLRRLVGELADAGVSAFVLDGSPQESVIAACEGGDIPLLQVPTGAVLAEVERAIVGLILDRDGQLRRRAEEIYGRLLSTMLGNAGLPALVEALAEASGLRAAVFDDYLALEACTPNQESFRQALSSAAGAVLLRDTAGWLARQGRPLALRFEHGGSPWVGQLYPLQIGATWAGYLGLFGRPGQAGELDRLLAERAATLVALEVAKQRAVGEATQRWRGEFLDDLLEGNFPSDEAILARGRQLGYDLLRPHLTFILGADPPHDGAAPVEVPLSSTRRRRRFAEVARTALLRLQPRALAVERDGMLVALLPEAEAAEWPAAAALVEQVRSETDEALPGGVSAGLGRAVAQPRDFGPAQREAAQALGIAQKLLGGGRTVHYEQLGVERLLFHLLGHPALEQFARDLLGPLMAYDALHRGELIRTLETFLACNGNHVRAAQELHLHRNTLLYRLERAREILSRDLEDADTRLALQIALRIRGALPAAAPNPAGSRRVAGRRRRAG